MHTLGGLDPVGACGSLVRGKCEWTTMQAGHDCMAQQASGSAVMRRMVGSPLGLHQRCACQSVSVPMLPL